MSRRMDASLSLSDQLEPLLAGRNRLRQNHAASDDPQRAQPARRSLDGGTLLRS